ncbi:MAG TPA: TldD/PmbA family protein [bacterium]
MFDRLKKALASIPADYADIRYEIKHETRISFDGKELSQVAINTSDGFVLRVLKGGGFASCAFTGEKDLEKAVKRSLDNAKIIGRANAKPTVIAAVPVIKEDRKPNLKEDPRLISLEEKIALTKHYNSIATSHPSIATTSIGYLETVREKYFISSDGAQVREDLVTTSISGMITSSDGTLLQNIRVAVGGSNGFAILRNRDDVFENKKQLVVGLLKAQPVSGGVYNVILNNSMAGVFTHEAFGHFSEADSIEDYPTMRKKMQIGARLGSAIVTITDNPTMPDQLGFYYYDDEGVKAQAVTLLKEGILAGRLHSRRTAAEFDEPANGRCVAEDYRYAPIVRMGTIFIRPGKDSVDELFAKLGDGLYIVDAKGGQTGGEDFTFGAQYGYIVKRGKKSGMIRDINITGNLYQTLQNISAVANDFVLSQTGGCGKGQINIRSCHGGPHILVRDLVVGGH